MSTPLLKLTGITKRFGAVRGAHRRIASSFARGEVHALMGENGAGKSTLMNIVGGVLQPDGGEIEIDGAAVRIADPGGGSTRRHRPRAPGDRALPGHLGGREHLHGRDQYAAAGSGWTTSSLRRRAEAVLADLHPVPVAALAGDLPIASQQIVEIAKALTLNCKVLIFDEPTAALTEARPSGCSPSSAASRRAASASSTSATAWRRSSRSRDRITVLRDGAFVETLQTAATTPEAVAAKMVGRALPDLYPAARRRRPPASPSSRWSGFPTAASSTISASRCAQARSSGSAG